MTRMPRLADRTRQQAYSWHLAVLLGLVLSSVLAQAACRPGRGDSGLPAALSDEEFWSLSTRLSEPAGEFTHSDNLVSNELDFVNSAALLRPRGGVYIGVGPEQNFSFIARLRPAMAFIVDIRQENRNLHLLYKALFALSADRADFVSRLFSRDRPPGIGSGTTVQELFAKFERAKAARGRYEASARLIRQRLVDTHRFPLSANDLAWIDSALHAFYSDGPDIHYGRTRPGDSPRPSYRALMTATDLAGRSQAYLATEDGFAFVKDLHARNLIVPVVGDFGGPAAIRRTGDYIRDHGATVSAFYSSNVEVYLTRRQADAFCRNLSSLPRNSRTWFIQSRGMRLFKAKLEGCAPGS